MDRGVRDDIAAAAAVHHELGNDYDSAVAEGLIERIGAEIDKRVDARLDQQGDRPARRSRNAQLNPAARSSWEVIVLGLGSMTIGFGTTGVVVTNGGNGVAVVLIWVIIAVINIAYSRRR